MSEEKEEEKETGKSGSHTDNDLSEVQEIMRDNDIPFYHSKEEEDNDDEDGKHTTH
jgi:hypothetical protein